MGVEYFLVNDEHKEMYWIGRGFWHDVSASSVDDLRRVAKNIAEDYSLGRGEARRFANELVDWVNERGGTFRILSDVDDEYQKVQSYEQTGSCYDRKIMTQDQIKERVVTVADQLRDELGADHVEISMCIEEIPMLENQDERHIWHYDAKTGFDSRMSGYFLQRVKSEFSRLEDPDEE